MSTLNPRKGKIGRRIVGLVAVSVSLTVAVLTGCFLWIQLRETIESTRANIQAIGYVFASATADDVAAGNDQAVLNALRSIRHLPHVRFVVAMNAEGRELASLGSASMLQSDIVVDATQWSSVLTHGWLPVMTEIVKAGQPVGRLLIVADVSELRMRVVATSGIVLLVALFGAGLEVAAAFRLQRRITGPILSLTSAMHHVRSAKDYRTQVQHDCDDETGVLLDTFNGMIEDIAYRDDALQELAYYDPLTGLANRRAFQQQLDQILETSAATGQRGAALYLIDLDEFKTINDSYGHTAGDALLSEVAARFKAACGVGQFLARLGGDEFAVVATDVKTEEEAQDAIGPVIAALIQPMDILGRKLAVGASVGVVMIPRDGTTASDLLRRADLALYHAKREGRGRLFVFQPWLDSDMQFNTALAQDLRLAAVSGQLHVHFQAQVNLRSGKTEGVESLLRWKHPVHGNIPPGKFIPIAESNGLICELGQWILEESCKQAKSWIDRGIGLRQMAVNVSVAQIRQADFGQEVQKVLRDTGLPPSVLCLELTESLFAGGSIGRVREVLSALKKIGVTLALDDFGTGYSSLAYLHQLPFDKLKIDRAFVTDVPSQPGKRRLLKSMIDLSHAMNLSVVAEGAETEQEVAVLAQLGADYVQGYVFGRPVPADQIFEIERPVSNVA